MATATQRPASPNPQFASAPAAPTTTTTTTSSATAATVPQTDTPTALKPHTPHRPDADRSPKSARAGLAPRRSPVALTGAAAMAELRKRKYAAAGPLPTGSSRETSPNPAAQAVQSLMGSVNAISRASDAPAPPPPSSDKPSEALQKVAASINVPANTQSDATQISPVSMGSFGTTESLSGGDGSALTATASDNSVAAAHPQFVAEPAEMNDQGNHDHQQQNHHSRLGLLVDDDSTKAYSYPGPPPHPNSDGPSRGASLPGYGQNSPKSPATNKRHKCPYCSTDFTRHHNLKSHLLTHSQEKPYVCQTCPARFRRLHDLKRHTKLHTGERPHTCDKCGRRFARGDALARHNKGPGGCAGRRSSFGGDDDFDGDGGEGMDGVEYTGEEDEGSSPPEHGRRGSEPNRKRAHIESPYDPNRQVYRQQSSTYPPVYPPPPQGRNHAGEMGPPQVILPSPGQATSPRETNNYPSPAIGSSMTSAYYPSSTSGFPSTGGMTESPKPLSPGGHPDQQRLSVGDASMSGTMNRNRSPSLTTQFQQAHFGRGSGGRTPPHSQAPVLPPLSSSHATGRTSLPSSTTLPGPSLLHNPQGPPAGSGNGEGSNPSSLSSHGQQSSGSSIRDVIGHEPSDLWAYVRGLESRFSRMRDEYELRISRLQEEVISLRSQVVSNPSGSSSNNPGTYSSDIPQPRY